MRCGGVARVAAMGKGTGSALASDTVALVQKERWPELAKAVSSDSALADGTDNAGRSLLHYVLWKQAPEGVATADL